LSCLFSSPFPLSFFDGLLTLLQSILLAQTIALKHAYLASPAMSWKRLTCRSLKISGLNKERKTFSQIMYAYMAFFQMAE